MKRREFTSLLGGAISGAMWPWNGLALSPLKRPLIGFLALASRATGEQFLSGFPQGMRGFGYLEGRDFGFEARYANEDVTLLSRLADDLVRLQPDVIVAGPTAPVLALKQATSTLPIVGVNLSNPVGLGLIASESRPGTNVTGILVNSEGMAVELLEIARSLIPAVSAIGIFVNVSNSSSVKFQQEVHAAGAKFGLRLVPVEVQHVDDIARAFQTLQREGAKLAMIGGDCLYLTIRRQIAAYALAARTPTIHYFREAVEAGGLLAYGIDLHASYARAAYFVHKILNGEKPADLPVDSSPKLKLVINHTIAQAIGLTIPPKLLTRADEVIE
jgi:putative ABC transport system substrate-binding protein